MSKVMLGLKLLLRDWRGGELGLLLAALVVAVTIVVSIALFVERIQGAILAESSQFLAADRVLRSSSPIPEEWLTLAHDRKLESAQVLNFPTMAYVGEALELAAVKATSEDYPLLGSLEIKTTRAGAGSIVKHGPAKGEVWVAPRLLGLLGIDVGEDLFIGEASLRVSALIVREPDAGFSLFSYGPRVLMNLSDIENSGVVQPGSRVQYNLLLTGTEAALSEWQEEISDQLTADQSVLGVRDGQPQLARSIDRAERFLLLAGSMGVVLAGVAIAIASRRYTERHYDYVGILKSLGASSKTVLGMYLGHLSLLCLTGVVLGSTIGWGLHLLAIESIRELLLVELPTPGLSAFGLGALTAFISFFAFACPALLHLQKVAPMRVLRKDLGTPDFNSRIVLWLGIAGLLVLIYMYSGSMQITLALSAGVGSIAAVVLLGTWLMLRAAPQPGSRASKAMGLAIAGIRRRASHSALQVFVFTVVLLLVLVLLLARNSLLAEWRTQIPENTPNHFLLNISPAEVPKLEALLNDNNYQHAGVYPMVRARFSAHNGLPPERRSRMGDASEEVANNSQTPSESADSARAEEGGRQLALTWAEAFPEDNELVEGRWWHENEPGLLSLESEFAERYGIQLGDTITFTMISSSVELTVSSIRKLDWEQMRPNFFAIASPGSLDKFDAIYMTSFFLPEGDKAFLNELLRTLPTVSVLEMDRIIEQVSRIIEQVSSAVELVLGLIVLSAAIVLFASIQTSMDERFRENAVLKTLGARFSLLRATMFYEFAILGLLAGSMASVAAELVIALIQTQLMQLEYSVHYWVFLVGPLAGALLVAILGVTISYKSLSSPPATVLRELS
ncbi:MAG: ABC transporter permease [Pseudomonadales bacterium]